MSIKVITIFPGPSVYSSVPVVHLTTRTLAGLEPERLTAFFAALCTALPELKSHCCSDGTPGPLRADGEGEPSLLFERICVVLQNLAGAKLDCARDANTLPLPDSKVVLAYEEAEVGIEAARVTERWFRRYFASSDAVNFGPDIDAFLALAQVKMLPVQDRTLVQRARDCDIPVVRMMGRILQLGQGCRQQRMNGSKSSYTNVVGNDIASNKDYTRRLLEELGLPNPRYKRVWRWHDAVSFAKKIGYPVVVKPNKGNMGRGVSIGMSNAEEVRAAYQRAREYDNSILVEELINGADYRMLVINGKLCAASKREPAHVVGDGQSTVEELVDAVNRDPRRGIGPRFSWTRITLNEQSDRLLGKLGYTRQSVPSDGETVYLRRNANTSDGGTAVDVTDDVHPDNREIAECSALALGLDIVGVDFLTQDITQSMRATGGVICEINSRPGMRKHMWPAAGKPRDVIGPIIDMLFPDGANGRIPICIIGGSGDRNLAARMLARVLTHAGHYVGLVSNGAVYLDGNSRYATPPSLTAATRAVLLDPRVTAVVIDAAPKEILAQGLGVDKCDVAVIIDSRNPKTLSQQTIAALGVLSRSAREALVFSTRHPGDLGTAKRARIRQEPAGRGKWCKLHVRKAARLLGIDPQVITEALAAFTNDPNGTLPVSEIPAPNALDATPDQIANP